MNSGNSRFYQRKFVATIGMFDGVHSGHKFILRKIINRAKRQNVSSLVITFWPHPKYILMRKFPGHIMNLSRKKNALLNLGIDNVWVIKATESLLNMDGFSFINKVAAKFLIKEMVVGEDFKFGHRSMWGVDDLRNIGSALGFSLRVVKKIKRSNIIVSSSFIRNLIHNGDFASVKQLMGENYVFEGKVVKGRGLGTKLGYPTANVDNIDNLVLPGSGVYAAVTYYGGRKYLSAVNIGFKPTVQVNGDYSVEAHIFNFSRNIRGKRIKIMFLEKIREERKFASIDFLSAGIKKDLEFISSKYSSVYRSNTADIEPAFI